MKLREHFEDKEFACKCGCGFCKPDPLLLDGLEELRHVLGDKPIIINSACRCEKHNAESGGAKTSQHLTGKAADIRVAGVTPEQLREAAYKVPVFNHGGIGIYNWGIHVDVRGHKARWDYR